MELIERDMFLSLMNTEFEKVQESEGHCILVSGEAGIGKTSLVKTFCKKLEKECKIYQGTCDALFTPRPLGPLFDIILQMHGLGWENTVSISDRSAFFSRFHYELENREETTIIIVEDIHWADEATLDFIKFFARRITRLHCFFILTYRDNEVHSRHPLRTVLGQLPPDTFTRLQLTPLSRKTVEKMAEEKGYSGEDVFSISGGNPFYVNEILASYSLGVPDNIKDSILSVYNRLDEITKQVWQILSVLPTGFEIKYLEKMESSYAAALHSCLDLKILIQKDGIISFKHELYRRTIENSLSPLVRLSLNRNILELFRENFERNGEIERIIHHAKNANEYETVVKYAPLAAKQAITVGSHSEAAKLYLTAIEYYQGNEKDILIQFYESYAFECYLTNQIKEAIIYSGKSLNLLGETSDSEKTGNCLRLLSRLWWLDGNRKKAESFGEQAIKVFDNQPPSPAKAMAYSNMSQLKMLFDQTEECMAWGDKAIAIAREVGDEETLSHALNNVGSIQMIIQSSRQKGIESLQHSLKLALKNSYHDHAGRAYTNLGSVSMRLKNYGFAKKVLDDGIKYCEERDLDSWKSNMLSFKARLNLETGNWKEAYSLAEDVLKNANHPAAVIINALVVVASINLRTGTGEILPFLLEAESKAFENMEMQRIIPALVTLLEYEWLTGEILLKKEVLDRTVSMLDQSINSIENNEFAFWLLKARKQRLPLDDVYEGFDASSVSKAQKAARLWEKAGNPYAQALTLFQGNDDDKRKAITIVKKLGATTVYEKMKYEMRAAGIKKIPRGIRKSTQSNRANLTERELDVLQLLKDGLQNKEIGAKLFISPKTVDHHISSILFKLDVNSRAKAAQEAINLEIIK